jgi:hypothetical protein
MLDEAFSQLDRSSERFARALAAGTQVSGLVGHPSGCLRSQVS